MWNPLVPIAQSYSSVLHLSPLAMLPSWFLLPRQGSFSHSSPWWFIHVIAHVRPNPACYSLNSSSPSRPNYETSQSKAHIFLPVSRHLLHLALLCHLISAESLVGKSEEKQLRRGAHGHPLWSSGAAVSRIWLPSEASFSYLPVR